MCKQAKEHVQTVIQEYKAIRMIENNKNKQTEPLEMKNYNH